MRIQRFQIIPDNDELVINPKNDGEWLKWEDIKHLMPKKTTERVKMAKLKSAVKLFNDKLEENLRNSLKKE